MLTLTPTAAQAVQALVANTEVDDDTGGLRIAAAETAQAEPGLQLALVDGPEATDAEIESQGAHVFVEPVLSEVLADKVLDASVDNGRVQFVLRGQSDGAPPE
jgi:Fe-S cluster assembly iron-binding protein IscA